MSKHTNRIIDVISGIDEALVDRATAARIKFFKARRKNRKKKFIPIIALAAALALIMGAMLALFIPMLKAKQVPIYTGMTASGSMQNSAYAGGLTPLSAIIPLDNENFEGNNGNHGSNNPNKKPAKDIIEEEMSTEAPETTVLPDGTIEVIPQDELYYAKPNEDIFITIHFDNPDEYKIMSFKLNGKAYADYMFEYGSDYENIIIKVNVGDVEGLIDYTIDAIQYADRETLKYVEMKGDPTLTIGVATEKQPVAEVTDELIGINEMSFKVNVTDEIELIKKTEGKLYAVLTDGETLVEFKEFKVSDLTEVKFENLKTSTYYEYAIVAQYDALDGEGFKYHVIYSKEITTRDVLAFSEVTSDKTSISFTTVFNEDAETKEITAIKLYLGEKKVRDIALDATVIEGLLSGNEYKIVISYLNKGKIEAIEYKIRTALKETPTVELSQNGESTQTSFEFDLVYTDIDEVGQITKIELLHGNDEPIVAENLDVRTFENLLSDNGYTVRVTFVYNLNDGIGEQTVTSGLTVKTKAKTVPTVELNITKENKNSIEYAVSVTDPDGIYRKNEIYIVDAGGNRVNVTASGSALTGLTPATKYSLVLVYDYDLNDGQGVHTNQIKLGCITDIQIEYTSAHSYYDSREEGEKISGYFDISAPDHVTFKAFYINGQRVEINSKSGNRYYVNYIPDKTGVIELDISEIEYEIFGVTKNHTANIETGKSVIVFGEIKITNVSLSNGKNYMESGESAVIYVDFEGSEGYTIKKINRCDATKISETRYSFIPSKFNILSSIYSIEYEVNGIVRTVEGYSYKYIFYQFDTTGLTEISTPEQLMAITQNGKYKLTADIDMTGYNWTPKDFDGYLDGNGFKIKNLTVNSFSFTCNESGWQVAYCAMFAHVKGVLRNVDLVNLQVNFSYDPNNVEYQIEKPYIGGLVASSSGIIVDCDVEGTINLLNFWENDFLSTNISTFCGYTSNCIIDSCSFNGSIVFQLSRGDASSVFGGAFAIKGGYYHDYGLIDTTCTNNAQIIIIEP